MKVDGTKEEEVEMGGVVEEEETSVKKSKKKKGSSANKKKKRKSLTVGEVGMGMVMEEIFPDLPKPAVAAATDGGVGEEEKVSKAHNEAEEQMNREFTASCTTDAPPGSDQAQDPTPMELDSTPGLDFAIHEDNEADVKGAEEIKELIEEVFARPEFEYQAVEEESVVNGAGSIGESVTAVGSREESPATLTLAATDNTSNAPENDDITTIKSLLQTLDGKLSGLALESTVQGQQDKIKDLHKGLEEAYNGMVKLSGRLNRDEMRAAIRHEILFNGMKSIVGELGALRRQQETGMEYLGLQIQSPLVAAPRKKWEEKDKNQEGKKALESCLRTYLDDMGRATEREQVGEKGKLAVEYAGRVLGGL
ncbi:hypothetical protein QBC41DRAFT_367669 [Cercophora samala]|uniref:Uncharacterized protein n=1 Tax=Cercophora samala TaxID=330535 RepID=A0AA39Z6R5_9PEZI|nr:hypothetical protein QBC41DRAFT_367669 [Cercophora samala]